MVNYMWRAQGSIGVGIFVLSQGIAIAADDAAEAVPFIQIDVPIELQLDVVTDPDFAELSDLYATIEPSVAINVASWLTIEFGSTYEPVEGPVDDRAFEDHGLYLNTAQAVASFGSVTLQAGKFAPNFSVGFELTPGLNNDALNADAEIAERVGFAAAYNLTGEGTAGGVIVSGAAFRRDTSVLSESLFTNRGRLHVSDAGPGNHDGLESFTLAVDAFELESLPGVHLHAAYLHQSAGEGDPADEYAWVLGANWMIDAGEAAKYQLLEEWARSEDALGFGDAVSAPGASQDLVTLGAGGTWRDEWTGSIVYGLRNSDDPVGGDVDEHFVQLTGGYVICDDLSIEAGWQSYDDGSDTYETFSVRLASGWEYAVE
ncbi:MAG: hypothetical protein ABL996_12265 [Micropepsaceae bacterium]